MSSLSLDLLLHAKGLGEKLLLLYQAHEQHWDMTSRPSQKEPPKNWSTWLIMAGRGFGKTRTGAETIRSWALSQRFARIALVGKTLNEAREIMVEGESGLLKVHPKWQRPTWDRSQNKLIWNNGCEGFVMSAHNPDRFRGPQFGAAWVDELCKFKNPDEFWMQLSMCLRLGPKPKCIVTTTPKPMRLLEQLIVSPLTHVTRGTTFDNEDNLSPGFTDHLKQTLSQTMIAQELHGELLHEQEGALWNRAMIRYKTITEESFKRVVIAIDPATTHHSQSDETGIIVAALTTENEVIILDDLSGRHAPSVWAKKVMEAYIDMKVDHVVAEVNKGGDLVERILTSLNPHISYKAVRATRGKLTRAEPVSALYEREKVFHVRPFRELETQLCTHTPHTTSSSPDRLDALVWAVTDLMLSGGDVHAWVV